MRVLSLGLLVVLGLVSLPAPAQPADAVNGCTFATATDLTAQATVSIAFGGAVGQNYVPKCVRVMLGAQVTISGVFSSHPLEGGAVINGVPTPADSGPFVPPVSGGSSHLFIMSANGIFPYFCQAHGSGGMKGVVYVGPLPPLIFADSFESP